MTDTHERPTPWPVAAHPVRLAFAAEEEAVRTALGVTMAAFKAMGVPAAARGTAEIVLAEALNNVVEHAYGEGAPGEVKLAALPVPEGLAVTIDDTGRPLPRGEIPPGRRQNLDVPAKDLPEGGFGWMLIRTLTRDLSYVRQGERNRLTFLLPF